MQVDFARDCYTSAVEGDPYSYVALQAWGVLEVRKKERKKKREREWWKEGGCRRKKNKRGGGERQKGRKR